MCKSKVALFVAVEAALLVISILFWASFASYICIVIFCLLLIHLLLSRFAPFLKARDYGGINKKYDDLDPINLFYKKHKDLVDPDPNDQD